LLLGDVYRPLKNAITIDVEDWFHVCGVNREPDSGTLDRRVVPNIERLLSLLEQYKAPATFFILGSVAEEEPSLAPLIAGAGHEIASHGYSHRLLSLLSPDEFRDEIRRTGDILERQTGRRPIGFRAPQWSLRAADTWAFDILREEGYSYDSSLNPLPFIGDRSGPRIPFRIRTGNGDILEIPPMVTHSLFGNLPTGGGWGFRFFPLRMIIGSIRSYNRFGSAAVLYLHPREMEADGPRLKMSPLRRFTVYGTRSEAGSRLRPLLERFRFTTLEHLAETWESL
jgi:polysaccharide deacetylase family protein (PEP-CTERM system associated)